MPTFAKRGFAAVLFLVGAMQFIGPALAQSKTRSMIGEWRGSYVCLQGPTSLTLTIDKESGDTFSGYFHFYPPRRNPVAKEGCYSVEGRRAGDGGVTVTAGRWISRPQGYVTVDLVGKLGSSGLFMTGDVEGPPGIETRCQKFELNWNNPRPKIAGVCRGELTASAGGDAR